jgi:hypothetical protein
MKITLRTIVLTCAVCAWLALPAFSDCITTVTNPVSQFSVNVDGLFSGGVSSGRVMGEWSDVQTLPFVATPDRAIPVCPGDPINSLLFVANAPDEDPPHAVERARRRWRELEQCGIASDLGQIQRDIEERDARDSQREVSPLSKAPDTVEADTDRWTIEQFVERSSSTELLRNCASLRRNCVALPSVIAGSLRRSRLPSEANFAHFSRRIRLFSVVDPLLPHTLTSLLFVHSSPFLLRQISCDVMRRAVEKFPLMGKNHIEKETWICHFTKAVKLSVCSLFYGSCCWAAKQKVSL